MLREVEGASTVTNALSPVLFLRFSRSVPVEEKTPLWFMTYRICRATAVQLYLYRIVYFQCDTVRRELETCRYSQNEIALLTHRQERPPWERPKVIFILLIYVTPPLRLHAASSTK